MSLFVQKVYQTGLRYTKDKLDSSDFFSQFKTISIDIQHVLVITSSVSILVSRALPKNIVNATSYFLLSR